MILNKWPDFLDNKVLSLLERSVERRICSTLKHPYIPTSGERFIFHKKYDKLGKAIFFVETRQGIETSQSTKKKDCDNIDVFHYDCFLELAEKERIAVLIYIDPFDELSDKDELINFLKFTGLNSNRGYTQVLEDAMYKLQRLSERKGLVLRMNNEDELRGLTAISGHFGVSVPTLYRMIDKYKLPVIYFEGEMYALKSKMDEKKREIFNDEANYVYNRKRGRRKKNNGAN